MTHFETFLKVLNKVEYPTPNIISISKIVGYNLKDFIPELVEEVGENKANWFVNEAISKMSTKKGIKIQLSDEQQYIYIIIQNAHIEEGNVHIDWSWGESHLLSQDDDGNEVYKTLEEIEENLSMGEFGDFDDMINYIKDKFHDKFYNNCGFKVWWDRLI